MRFLEIGESMEYYTHGGKIPKSPRGRLFTKNRFRSDILGYNSKTMNEKSLKTWRKLSIQLMLTLK